MKKTILLEKKYLYVRAQKGFQLTGVSTETFPIQTGFYLFHVENVAQTLGNSYVDITYQDDDLSFDAYCSDLYLNEVQSSPVVAVENLEDVVTAGFTGLSDAMSAQNQNLVNILSSLSDSGSTSFEKLVLINDALRNPPEKASLYNLIYDMLFRVKAIVEQDGFMEDPSHPLMYFYQWFPNVLPWGFGQGVSDAMSVMNQNLVNISNSIQSLSFRDSVYLEKVESLSESFLSITMDSPFSPQSGFSCHKEIVIDSNQLSALNNLVLINCLGDSSPFNATVLALDAMANRKKFIFKEGSSNYVIPKTDILVDGVTEVHILFDFVY